MDAHLLHVENLSDIALQVHHYGLEAGEIVVFQIHNYGLGLEAGDASDPPLWTMGSKLADA